MFVASRMLEFTVSVPAEPEVPDRNDIVVPSLFTTAVTPIPALLIVSASPERVAFKGSTFTVCVVPLPTWIEMDPVSTSFLFGIALKEPTDGVVLVPDVPE